MKKTVLLLSISLATLVSCNDEEALDVQNPNNLDQKALFATETLAESAVTGAYAALQLSGTMGSNYQNTAFLMSEAGRLGNFIPANQTDVSGFGTLKYNSSSGWGADIYVDTYRLINRANQILDNLKPVPGISVESSEVMKAEAKFLKALGLFWASTTFNNGNVPIPKKSASTIQLARIGISSRQDVYSEIIDLLNSAEKTFVKYNVDNTDPTRATLGSIKSLLGKVYLYNNQNRLAADKLREVIDSGQYSLESDINNNFNIEGELNSESIFEIGFDTNLDEPNFGDGEGDKPNEATLRGNTQQRANGGWGWLYTSHFITNLYRNEVLTEASKGDVLDIFDGDGDLVEGETYNRAFSKRMMASIAYENDRSKFYDQGVVSIHNVKGDKGSFVTVPSRSQLKKFTNWFTKEAEAFGRSAINERVIRYADVLLMYAEATLKADGDGGVNNAITYIDKVRSRSGLIGIEELFQGHESPIVTNQIDPFLNPDFDLEVNDPIANDSPKSGPDGGCGPFLKEDDSVCDSPDLVIQDEDHLESVLQDKVSKVRNALPDVFKLPAKSLNAENIIKHLFDAERPAEFAFEGHGILWNDLRRRPGGAEERIRELSDIDYQFITPNLDAQTIFWNKFDSRENNQLWLRDFITTKKEGLDIANDLVKDLYLYIPLRAIQENPALRESGDLLFE